MKKYFICSDIHSFFTIWQKALLEKGFDINNPEHILIILGDIFDRGTEPMEVYQFLKSFPKERRILIRGNHELLLEHLVQRGYAEKYDLSNGTLDTLFYFCYGKSYDDIRKEYYRQNYISGGSPELDKEYHDKIFNAYSNEFVLNILDWIFSDEWVNYLETEHYIFVHSFIPVHRYYKETLYGFWETNEPSYREDWRNATDTEWEDSMWGCPWKQAKQGLNKTGKTIVCGHWYTADFFNNLKRLNKKYDVRTSNPIFKSKKYKIIGLDACTAATKKVNVLVLNEDEL